MAICTVTDPAQGLSRQPVRIIEIQENGDFTLTVTAEEFHGTASAPEYGQQATTGFVINYNADPGATNAPLIFEPTDQLGAALTGAGGLLVAAAVSGVNTALWGGCFVWASYDNANYQRVGEIVGPARMGTLSAALPAATVNPVGLTIDNTNVLAVDLTESAGTLASGTVQDATSFATACIVGSGSSYELLSYETAQLTAASKYSLTYLVRGIYGSEADVASHPVGTPFARLDANIVTVPYKPTDIGGTIYLKFQSFNVYQGGLQSLANVPAVAYQIAGLALSSPLPNVVNLRTVFDVNSGFTELDWDEVVDFRQPIYEVRSGTSAAAAMTLGTVAHPPFRVPGDGTYWVAARAQPVAGLTVYSENFESVTIAGAVITQNVILTVDLKALGWPGTFTGGAGIDSTLNAIRTGGGNILTDANVLTTPDILNYGAGTQLVGIYYPDDHAYIDIGYVATASVAMKFQPTGVPIGQNILTIGNVLTTPDILGSASTQFINNYPLINTATTAGGNLYAQGDLYQYPDLYVIGDANWNGWQKFSPGTYQTRFLDFAFSLSTIDPNTISYDLAWTITITIPARVDTYALKTTSTGNTTVQFAPGNSISVATTASTATSSAVLTLSSVTGISVGMYAYDTSTPGAITGGQTVQSINTGAGTVTLTSDVNATVNSGDVITFSTLAPAAFNGGPGPGNLPSITWGIVNAAAGDDLIITALSLSAITFEIVNGGSRVVRNLNLFAEGF